MFVEEAGTIFRDYCDEPDTTFMNQAEVARYLKLAYQQFRDIVVEVDPQYYAINVQIIGTGTRQFDLASALSAVRLLGREANITGARLHKLVRLDRIDGAGNFLWNIEPVNNNEQLHQVTANDSNKFNFEGTTLNFSWNTTGTYQLTYIAVDNFNAAHGFFTGVDWAGGLVAASNVEIDNLYAFHDLIPLLAYTQYSIRDGMINEQLERQMLTRKTNLKAYIETGRNIGANQVVHVQDGTWY